MLPIQLPRDEFAHPNSPYEWWYYTAFLEDVGSDERCHYVSAFMRWRSVWVSYMCWRSSASAGVPKPLVYYASPQSSRTDKLVLGNPRQDQWSIQLNRSGFSVHRVGQQATLFFRPQGGAVLHTSPQAGGIRNYGGNNEMAWYSRPWLNVVGEADVGASRNRTFQGLGWFEHQWGNTDFRHLAWRYVPFLLDDGQRGIAFSFKHEDFPGARTTEVALFRDGYAHVLPETSLSPLDPGGLTTTIVGNGDTALQIVSFPGAIDLGIPRVPTFFEGESQITGRLLGTQVTGKAITEYEPA